MKLRKSRTDISDLDERSTEEAVRQLAAGEHEAGAPSATYFANLMAKTNERIDHVTSGKALSLSWLARVAVPGVVAILFFFIGFHYYAPDSSVRQHSIADAVRTLPASDFDSLLVASAATNPQIGSELPSDVFDVTKDQMAEFFISTGSPMSVLEVLPEQQVTEVASILESRSGSL